MFSFNSLASMIVHNKDLGLQKFLEEVMSKQRKQELNSYCLFAKAPFNLSNIYGTMKRMASVSERKS